MSDNKKAAAVADEIELLLMEKLNGPKDAAMALLIAHVLITKRQGLDREAVGRMLTEYWAFFRKAYFDGVDQ